MKKLFAPIVLFALLLCGESKAQELSGYIKEIDRLGNPNLSITTKDMKEAGFEYGDLLEVEFEHIGTIIMPYTTSFTEVGIGGISLCDYRAKGDNFHFSVCQANFYARVGGQAGEKFTIRMKGKKGFLEVHNEMQAVYSMNREDYPSDEVFANFREVRTTGIGKNVLYRGSNPLNSDKNKARYTYVDKLAEKAGIATEINLSDTDEKVEKMMASEGYAATYCPALYKKGSVINLGIQWDMFCQDTYEKVAKAVRFMIAKENKPPFLIHCVEGKDRCGFFAMLLEGLAGASYQEIKDDYMLTYKNFYGFKEGEKRYDLTWKLNGFRFRVLMGHPELLDHAKDVKWDDYKETELNPYEFAVKYLTKSCGLSMEECLQV